MIQPEARRVLERLSSYGFKAYLCGGGVRDLWLGKTPKDFDVATDARPEQIKRICRNTRIIGRRFRLAHVIFGDVIIETATFRALLDNPPPSAESVPVPSRRNRDIPDPTFATRDGVIVRDNQYGTPEEDARRRDFTVNGLFYDYKTRRILDYVGGIRDLQARVLRVIGDPAVRYHEDPVRMVRAVRIASQLDFAIEPSAEASIRECAPQLAAASHERMHEEMLKIFNCGHAAEVFRRAWDLGLFQVIYPEFSDFLLRNAPHALETARRTLAQFDIWKQNGLRPTPALQYALLFGPRIEHLAAKAPPEIPPFEATLQAVSDVIRNRVQLVLIPKSVLFDVERIMGMQIQMAKASPTSRYATRLRSRAGFSDALVYLKFSTTDHPDRKPLLEAWLPS
jgi:poly(A) polymerase